MLAHWPLPVESASARATDSMREKKTGSFSSVRRTKKTILAPLSNASRATRRSGDQATSDQATKGPSV